MSTWGFDGLDDNRGGSEPEILNGLQDNIPDVWEGLDGLEGSEPQYMYERVTHRDVSTTRHQLPPPDYSEALTLDEDDRREPENLNRQRVALDQEVLLPYLERQQSDELGFDQTAHPAAVSTPTSYDSHEFVTLEDSDSEDENEIQVHEMPPTRRSQHMSVVDLTEGSPRQIPQRQPKRKQSADAATASSSTRTKRRKRSADIEEIDLVEEAPSADEDLLQAQQQEAIRVQQQADEDAIPQKIGQRSCIICMENFTDCTATACGHFFCHECLIQALRAAAKNSDRGYGSCPVCRKSLKESKKSDVIPISFMTKKEYDRQNKLRA